MKNKFLLITTLSFILSSVLSMMSVQAQAIPRAAITLDGRQLFKVSRVEGFDAQPRADYANQILNRIVESGDPVQVSVVEINDLPVIQVNGTNLLTVTAKDAPTGMTTEEQAKIWRDRIEVAIAQAQEQRRPAYIRQALLISLGCLLVALALNSALSSFLHNCLHRFSPQQIVSENSPPSRSLELFLKIIFTLVRAALWLGAALYISNQFPQTRELSYQLTNLIVFSLTSPIIPLGDKSYSAIQVIILIALFSGLVIASRIGKKVLRSRVLSVTGINRGAQEAIALIANYTMIFIGTIVLLQIWGLDLSSLTIFAGVLGVGIGLGIQGIAKEFVSGLIIIFERPIQVGDFVNVGDFLGTVERISVRSTEIRTLDLVSIILPNSYFLEKEVVNWSHGSPITRLKLSIRVAYGSDLNMVREALTDAVKDYPNIISEPEPEVFFKGYGDSSLNLELLVWVTDPRKQIRIKSDLYFLIDNILRDRKIEVPIPQQDLRWRSGSLPLTLSPQLEDSIAKLLKKYDDNGYDRNS